MTSLSQITELKSAVSSAFQAYICAELGDSSVAHKVLKDCRYAYNQACVEYVELLLDSQCKEAENVCTENETLEIENEAPTL